MTTNRRSRRSRTDDGFWSEYVRSGSFAPTTTPMVAPTVAEAELLLEEARQAEAEQAAALARRADEDQRRRVDLERETADAIDALEERLDEVAALLAADIPADRDLRVLSRGFLHGFVPRGLKRVPPQDVIAARDDAAAQLLELAREADLLHDRLSSSRSDVSLAVDHPFVLRVDAVEIAAWQAFVDRVRVLAREASPTEQGVADDRSPWVASHSGNGRAEMAAEFGYPS